MNITTPSVEQINKLGRSDNKENINIDGTAEVQQTHLEILLPFMLLYSNID